MRQTVFPRSAFVAAALGRLKVNRTHYMRIVVLDREHGVAPSASALCAGIVGWGRCQCISRVQELRIALQLFSCSFLLAAVFIFCGSIVIVLCLRGLVWAG